MSAVERGVLTTETPRRQVEDHKKNVEFNVGLLRGVTSTVDEKVGKCEERREKVKAGTETSTCIARNSAYSGPVSTLFQYY
jgi:hypothetical protein